MSADDLKLIWLGARKIAFEDDTREWEHQDRLEDLKFGPLPQTEAEMRERLWAAGYVFAVVEP